MIRPQADSRPLDTDAATATRTAVRKELMVLVLLSMAAAVAFLATRAAASGNRVLRREDAAAWFRRGQQAADTGQWQEAVRALQRASGMAPDNPEFRLALADALSADKQDEAARQILLGVRERAPEDPAVNLRLARIEAHRGDTTAAQQYYHNALYGSWKIDDGGARAGARLELIRYLLDNGDKKRAVSELLLLSGNLPEDPARQTEAAHLFLQADDPAHALDHFERALAREPRNVEARAGAAAAAFASADYVRALRYARGSPPDPRLSDLGNLAERVTTGDPLRPRLGASERRARLIAGFSYGTRRLGECSAAGGHEDASLQSLHTEAAAIAPRLTPRALRAEPDIIDDAVNLVVRMVRRSSEICGPPSLSDRAWLLIGHVHDQDAQ